MDLESASASVVALPEAERVVGHVRTEHDPPARDGMPGHATLLTPLVPVRRWSVHHAARLAECVAAAFPGYPPYGGAFTAVHPHPTLAHGVPEAGLWTVEPAMRGRVDLRAVVSDVASCACPPRSSSIAARVGPRRLRVLVSRATRPRARRVTLRPGGSPREHGRSDASRRSSSELLCAQALATRWQPRNRIEDHWIENRWSRCEASARRRTDSGDCEVAMLLRSRMWAVLVVSCLWSGACGGSGPHSAPPPPFRVSSPNGGETWIVASQRTVLWSTGDYTGNVDIDLSTDGGTTWQLLVGDSPNDGSATVTVPSLPGSTMRIQVSAADGDPAVAASPHDASDGNFAISVAAFVERTPAFAGATYGALASGDFDGDGAVDLVVAGDDQATHVEHNDGQGAFAERPSGILGVQYASLARGDFDNDGDLDLAVSGYGSGPAGSPLSGPVCLIYRNDGSGHFTDVGAGIVGVYRGSLAWGDYDHDGDLDLAVSGDMDAYATGSPPNLTTRIYRNDGGGVFTDIGAGLKGVVSSSLAWGDFDRDGNLDLAVAGFDDSQAVTILYRNDGSGHFTDVGAGIVGVTSCALAWGDMDGDGDLDLAIAGYSSTGPVARIYRNTAGTFTDVAAGLKGVSSCSLAWGDYDADGDLDLAIAGQSDTGPESHVYRNDGTGFVDAGASLIGGFECSVAWGDFDGNGLLDLALLVGYTGVTTATRIYDN